MTATRRFVLVLALAAAAAVAARDDATAAGNAAGPAGTPSGAPSPPASLDAVYGAMPDGCAVDFDGHYRLIVAFVDEDGRRPVLRQPPPRLSYASGQATLEILGESYRLCIELVDTTLFGVPAAKLCPYRGIGSDIAGVGIVFAATEPEVRAIFERDGRALVSGEYWAGPVTPTLTTDESGHAVLGCDFSM